MRAAAAIALIFIARFAASAWFDPARDADIAWQQWLGRQILQTAHLPSALGAEAFTAPNAPWVPQEWALSLAVALMLNTPFFVLLVALTAIAGITVLCFTAVASRRLGASSVPVMIAVLCVGESMLESYGIRAQVFAWAFLAAFMYIVRCLPQRKQWWAIAVVAAWANVHASALLAPALLALRTLGVLVAERRISARLTHCLALTAAACVAVLATPLTYRLPAYAVQLAFSPIRTSIAEWQPTTFDAPSFTFGALPLLAIALFYLARSKHRNWSEIFVCSAVTVLAITALRNIPIAAIVVAPVAARGLSMVLPESMRINRIFYERGPAALFFGATSLAAIFVTFSPAAVANFKKDPLPSRAIDVLALQPGMHRLFCEDFAWCSLALAHRNVGAFIDGRCDPFPLDVWRDYIAVFESRGRWKTILRRRGVDAILFKNKGKLAQAAPLLNGWRLLYSDARYSLLVRERVRNAAYEH